MTPPQIPASFRVEQSHLDRGETGSAMRCPVALALHDALLWAHYVAVTPFGAVAYTGTPAESYVIDPALDFRAYVSAVDSGKPQPPAELHLLSWQFLEGSRIVAEGRLA